MPVALWNPDDMAERHRENIQESHEAAALSTYCCFAWFRSMSLFGQNSRHGFIDIEYKCWWPPTETYFEFKRKTNESLFKADSWLKSSPTGFRHISCREFFVCKKRLQSVCVCVSGLFPCHPSHLSSPLFFPSRITIRGESKINFYLL